MVANANLTGLRSAFKKCTSQCLSGGFPERIEIEDPPTHGKLRSLGSEVGQIKRELSIQHGHPCSLSDSCLSCVLFHDAMMAAAMSKIIPSSCHLCEVFYHRTKV